MKSMTGYGRGDCVRDGYKVTVEISSVNRKQSEVAVYLPRELELLEPRVREEIHQRVARGRLTARVGLQASAGRHEVGKARVNVELAKAYARELGRLARELKIPGGVGLEVLARAPGVFEMDAEALDLEALWPGLQTALGKALDLLVRMRGREGQHLQTDLKRRITVMRQAVARVQRQAPKVLERYREQLRERVKAAGISSLDSHDERLLKEVVLFADRSDITEELTRLQSHFNQFDDCLQSTDPVGRTLDFLSQEMNREINTIGSKANDGLISRDVVTLKTELEKFREQAQNVE